MTTEEVRKRLELLNTRLWPKAELESWIGINFARAHPLLAQFQMWNTGTYEAACDNPPTIDTHKFAIFLNSRKYVPLRGAAVSLGLTDESFRQVMAAERTRQLFQSEVEGAFPGVYNSEFISGFFKIFPRMRKGVFPDTDTFFRILHGEIREHLQDTVMPRMCETSRALREDPQHFGATLDCITLEPVSLPYQVFLNTHKPLQLRPDSCSWLTYFRFEDILRPVLMGSPPDCNVNEQAALRAYDPGN